MVLSALLWRKNCGSIKLYSDNIFSSFIEKNGLTELWDGGIDTSILEGIPRSINQTVFWAAAKLFALKDAEAPVAMVDNDLFFWKDISGTVTAKDITVLHREDLWGCYVPKELLGIPEGYSFDPEWDWNERPCNTAFAYFPHNEFKNIYTTEAIRFMTGNSGKDAQPSSQMVFAEQRILAMCAKQNHVNIKTIIDDPYDDKNDCFTHLWGAKTRARNNKKDMNRLLSAIMNKIKDIDDYYYQRIRELYPYNI